MTVNRKISVDYLARVEGEGALDVRVQGEEVTDVKFKIFEPPRFFEAFLRGREYKEAPDITARICGICPIAYQMSAIHAMEDAFGVRLDGQLRELRRLIYCGEWIESHVLHTCMLHVPDFLGYEDAIQMAKDHPEVVQKALALKKTGNDIVNLLGGREIHPINVRVGGFYRLPTVEEFAPLKERLNRGLEIARELTMVFAGLDFPDLERDYEFVALRHPDEYPFNEGNLVSTSGLNIPIQEYENHFEEVHVAHSNALQSVLDGDKHYLVGPMARYNLNYDKLPASCQQLAREAGLGETCVNQFQSILVRAVETYYACEEALRILDKFEEPDAPAIEIEPKAGTGHGCTEAPRGILYHKYRIDSDGHILDARIVPPTAQNQLTMEDDLRDFVPKNLSLSDEDLTWKCEQLIRNYDPCISCATHFLKLRIHRS